MTPKRTKGRGLATIAKLAMVAALCSGISTTSHVSAANPSLLQQPKLSFGVRADSEGNSHRYRVASEINILSEEDEAHYRHAFRAQKNGDWAEAEEAAKGIKDKRLLGHLLADLYQRRGAKTEELSEWLKSYGYLPEAETIYAKASYQARHGKKIYASLPPLKKADFWTAGNQTELATDFAPDLTDSDRRLPTNALGAAIQRALKKDDPTAARNLLIKAQTGGPLSGTFVADAEAAIAASFFYEGDREQAGVLAKAAAAMNQPLALWIEGLMAWEAGSFEEASTAFDKLSAHPALTPSNEAAAHFWAYRAESRAGHSREAYRHLEQASTAKQNIYGLMASQLMGRNPVALFSETVQTPSWNEKRKALIATRPEGARALALLQIGEPTLAEQELRRLNPRGDTRLQEAMTALAAYIPMPGLAMQLAGLRGENDPESAETALAASYPLPPWIPEHGFQIDKALLFALARHESLFDPVAISSRGAMGLMQIMPATASGMLDSEADAKTIKASGKLLDPSINMDLGQKYVRHLMSQPKIGNNLLFMLAAYNGGPNKAARWIEARVTSEEAKASRDPLLFMETLPVRETRMYIARVLPHYWAYQARLGQRPSTLKDIAENRWPRISVLSPETRHAEAMLHEASN